MSFFFFLVKELGCEGFLLLPFVIWCLEAGSEGCGWLPWFPAAAPSLARLYGRDREREGKALLIINLDDKHSKAVENSRSLGVGGGGTQLL